MKDSSVSADGPYVGGVGSPDAEQIRGGSAVFDSPRGPVPVENRSSDADCPNIGGARAPDCTKLLRGTAVDLLPGVRRLPAVDVVEDFSAAADRPDVGACASPD